MISVTVAIGDTWACCSIDADYSPDLTTQAAATAVAAVKAATP